MMTHLLGLGQSLQSGVERRAGLAKPRESLRLFSRFLCVRLALFQRLDVFPHVSAKLLRSD